MSELALYRKYRPGVFAEVMGQEPVVTVLEKAISAGNIAHAYLFAGSRGTGKTSVARIFAQAIGTSTNDLYEIDAASSRGIDEIRELREGIRSLPFESKYKVYIIDEVHMLTKEAFNALLKTLEEPPAHVIFILATTDTHKLPETIISRCQVFIFKKPGAEILQKMISGVAIKEGFNLEPSAARLIALAGDGAFRDALGILQKILTVAESKKISLETVEAVVGTASSTVVYEYCIALLEQKSDQALSLLNSLAASGKDLRFFFRLLLSTLRLAMLVRFAPTTISEIKTEVGEDEFVALEQLSKHPAGDRLSAILKVLLESYEEKSISSLPQLPLELATLKITQIP